MPGTGEGRRLAAARRRGPEECESSPVVVAGVHLRELDVLDAELGADVDRRPPRARAGGLDRDPGMALATGVGDVALVAEVLTVAALPAVVEGALVADAQVRVRLVLGRRLRNL